MMPNLYPNPNITNATGIFAYVNSNTCLDVNDAATCGVFGFLLLWAIFGIVFISQKDAFSGLVAFNLSSFITFILSTPLMSIGLVQTWMVAIYMIMSIIGGIMLFLQR